MEKSSDFSAFPRWIGVIVRYYAHLRGKSKEKLARFFETIVPEKSIWTQIPEVGASKRNLMNADKDRQKKSLDTK